MVYIYSSPASRGHKKIGEFTHRGQVSISPWFNTPWLSITGYGVTPKMSAVTKTAHCSRSAKGLRFIHGGNLPSSNSAWQMINSAQ